MGNTTIKEFAMEETLPQRTERNLGSRAAGRIGAALVTAAALVLAPAVAASAEDERHTVASGDTVWDLAQRYGTTVPAIVEANGLTARALIRIGQVLTIPGVTRASSSAAPSATAYTVVEGDTLTRIARQHGTSVEAIAAANGITNPSFIRIGQVLTVPGAAPASSAPPAASQASPSTTYTVVAGDTLTRIARRHGTTVDAIVAANSIKDPSFIRIGQRLLIPGGAASAPVTGLVGDTFAGRTYPADVVAAANQNKAALNAMTVPSRAEMQAMVVRIAKDMGVDPALAQAVAYQESGFNQRAVSPANAIGTMQVIPSSGQWASDLVGRELNLLNAEDNVTAGIAILKQLQRNGTPVETALAGYYQGEASVKKRGMNPDTVRYVASVIALMDRFK